MTVQLYRGAVMLVVLGIAATTPTLAANQRTQGFSLTAPTESPQDFPLPPIPPDEPPAESAAPTPGSAAAPPESAANGPQVSPGIFSQGQPSGGNGYLSGSTSQSEFQRRTPAAGFKLNVPLQ